MTEGFTVLPLNRHSIMMKSIFYLLWVFSLSTSLWNTAVRNCWLNMMPYVYLLFPFPYYWDLFISLLIFWCWQMPFQAYTNSKLHCINLGFSSFAECCTKCSIIKWRTGLIGPCNFQSLKHLMKFPIEWPKFSEARLKYLAHIELYPCD